MFLAIREITTARGRFALIGGTVALITLLLVMLSGLTEGLSKQNTSALESLEKEYPYISFSTEDPSFSESEMHAGDVASDGIPLGVAQTKLEGHGGVAVLSLPAGTQVPGSDKTIPEQGVLLSESIDAADSVTVDFHKGYFQPVACSAILLRDPADCALVSWHADYLNPEDATDHNLADFSLQTTRRFDALKLWMTLRTHGADALGEAFDACCAAARDAARRVDAHPRFALRATPELSTVLFTPADAPASLVHIVRQRLLERGDVIIATTTFEGAPCWKFTILDPQLRGTDIDAILGLIEREMNAVDQANAQPSPSVLAVQPAR